MLDLIINLSLRFVEGFGPEWPRAGSGDGCEGVLVPPRIFTAS
jgi:hypothetical protein